MKRINKETVGNEVRYTYKANSKEHARRVVFTATTKFNGCTKAFGGYDREHNVYTITICYNK